jgi:propionaldehyde dehydrogenase
MATQLAEQQVDAIVRQVMDHLGANGDEPLMPRSYNYRGVFPTPDEAIDAALQAQRCYGNETLMRRKAIIKAIRETVIAHAQEMSKMVVAETRMGRISDKVMKNLLVAEKTPGTEILPAEAHLGDDGLTIEETMPFGVILAITPVTNPTATIINNAISMLAGGNTVIFAPHPSALQVSLYCIDLLNEAAESAGGPPNLLVALEEAKLETVQYLMKHPSIPLICATGGPGVVDAALMSGKRAIGAAAGNPPVLVDDSADPIKAANDIIMGHSFDNNMPCTAEKEVVVTEAIADALMQAFRDNEKSYVLDDRYLPQLEQIALNEKRSGPNRRMVGQNACVLLKELGIDADEDLRTIIVEVEKTHPFIRHELMMPVLGVTRARDFEDAVKIAVEAEQGLHHSAIIHTENVYHMSEFRRAIRTTAYIKNAPSYAALGYGGEGYTSFTIAGRTGEGMTDARTFVRYQRCTLVGAFGIA